jgi:hypothetical protein
MRSLMIGVIAAAGFMIATPSQAANDGIYSTNYINDKSGKAAAPRRMHTAAHSRTHRVAIGHRARASYAYAPGYRRGSSIANDPIRRAMDDPRMYGRPDRH